MTCSEEEGNCVHLHFYWQSHTPAGICMAILAVWSMFSSMEGSSSVEAQTGKPANGILKMLEVDDHIEYRTSL